MDAPMCKDCAHFYQHYVLTEEKCIQAYCGHCCYGRQKRRRPDDKVCEGFDPNPRPVPSRRDSIQFLTTTVLEKILRLELPPEIETL